MTSFDGYGDKLFVFYDSNTTEVNLSLAGCGDGCGATVDKFDLPRMISDLLDAYAVRGEDSLRLIKTLAFQRGKRITWD